MELELKPSKRMFYCQDDGGQWNVPVTVVLECQFGIETLAIIMGKPDELMSGITVGHEGMLANLMLVNAQDLHDKPVD